MKTIDLNCDVGEGMPAEAALMPWITSANIACGGHTGDAATMQATIALCRQHGVAIGAHPSWPDREHFGRRNRQYPQHELYAFVRSQIENLLQWLPVAHLHHVKPHGALYNQSAADPEIAHTIARAVYDTHPNLILFGLSGSHSCSKAAALGLRVAHEVFADRRYEADGTLTPRSHPDALLTDPQAAATQALRLVQEGTVIARTGEVVALRADTLCIHGDGANALALAKTIHITLQQNGIALQSITRH
ncbi:MAG: 5-oxoprolinase subunit PxpA [Lacibacter sp.]